MNKLYAALASRPWVVERRRLDAICQLASKEAGQAARPAAKAPAPAYDLRDGVAVVPVGGDIIGDKGIQDIYDWWGIEYTDPYALAGTVRAAAADRKVSAILLDVNSPGGIIDGVKEAADAVWEARAAGLPVGAHVQNLDASAAYWISSQAGFITAGPTAEVGSIGVYCVLYDESGLADKLGIRVLVVSSGPHKGTGVPGAPIPEEKLAPFQQQIDDLAGLFKADVARGRGADAERVAEWATGEVWVAARARRLGLVDAVGSFEDALARCRRGSLSPSTAASPAAEASAIEEDSMAEEKKQAGEAAKAAETANLQTEAKAAGLEEGRSAARAELKALLAAYPKDRDFALEAYDKGLSPEAAKAAYADVLAARVEQLSQEKAELEARAAKPAAKAEAAGATAAPFSTPEGAAGGKVLAGREQHEAEYEASAELQAEFGPAGGKKAYVAYAERKAAGLIRGKGRGA